MGLPTAVADIQKVAEIAKVAEVADSYPYIAIIEF